MARLIEELQKDCLNSKISLTDLLRKARFIAQKLDIAEMIDFCTNELEGYTKSSVPKYRWILVTYKAFNPYRGWIPFDLPSTGPLSKWLKRPMQLSIGEMEQFLQSTDDVMTMGIPAEVQNKLCEWSDSPFQFEIKSFFSKTQFAKIFDSVKNKISDWAIDLERKGVLGEEYQFTQQEKDIAKNMTIININAPTNGTNIIGNMTNSSATVNNNCKIDFDSLKNFVGQIYKELEKEQPNNSESVIALKEKIELLEQSIENRDEGSVIDTLKNIATGAVSSGIWQVGAMVSSYISTIMGLVE